MKRIVFFALFVLATITACTPASPAPSSSSAPAPQSQTIQERIWGPGEREIIVREQISYKDGSWAVVAKTNNYNLVVRLNKDGNPTIWRWDFSAAGTGSPFGVRMRQQLNPLGIQIVEESQGNRWIVTISSDLGMTAKEYAMRSGGVSEAMRTEILATFKKLDQQGISVKPDPRIVLRVGNQWVVDLSESTTVNAAIAVDKRAAVLEQDFGGLWGAWKDENSKVFAAAQQAARIVPIPPPGPTVPAPVVAAIPANRPVYPGAPDAILKAQVEAEQKGLLTAQHVTSAYTLLGNSVADDLKRPDLKTTGIKSFLLLAQDGQDQAVLARGYPIVGPNARHDALWVNLSQQSIAGAQMDSIKRYLGLLPTRIIDPAATQAKIAMLEKQLLTAQGDALRAALQKDLAFQRQRLAFYNQVAGLPKGQVYTAAIDWPVLVEWQLVESDVERSGNHPTIGTIRSGQLPFTMIRRVYVAPDMPKNIADAIRTQLAQFSKTAEVMPLETLRQGSSKWYAAQWQFAAFGNDVMNIYLPGFGMFAVAATPFGVVAVNNYELAGDWADIVAAKETNLTLAEYSDIYGGGKLLEKLQRVNDPSLVFVKGWTAPEMMESPWTGAWIPKGTSVDLKMQSKPTTQVWMMKPNGTWGEINITPTGGGVFQPILNSQVIENWNVGFDGTNIIIRNPRGTQNIRADGTPQQVELGCWPLPNSNPKTYITFRTVIGYDSLRPVQNPGVFLWVKPVGFIEPKCYPGNKYP